VNGSSSTKMRERLLAPAGVLPIIPNTTVLVYHFAGTQEQYARR
jgi:hypothetical protein